MKRKTLIASHDEKLRRALEFLFRTEPDAQIAGSIDNVAGLLALAETVQPDLVLLDWEIPDKPGAELIAALQCINPGTKTMVFSKSEFEPQVRLAGANICITKDSPPNLILESYRALFSISPLSGRIS